MLVKQVEPGLLRRASPCDAQQQPRGHQPRRRACSSLIVPLLLKECYFLCVSNTLQLLLIILSFFLEVVGYYGAETKMGSVSLDCCAGYSDDCLTMKAQFNFLGGFFPSFSPFRGSDQQQLRHIKRFR